MTRHLYLPIEMGSRELGPRLLTAAIAAERGFEVVVGYQHLLYRTAEHLPAGIFFSKGTNNFFLKRVKRLRHANHAFAACEEESFGFVMEKSPITFNSSDLAGNCDLYLALGRDEEDYVKRRFGGDFPTALTGNARVDMLRPSLRKLYSREVRQIKKQQGDFILINTNFGLLNSVGKISIEKWFQNWLLAGVFDNDDLNENRAKFNEFLVWEQQNFSGVRALLHLLENSPYKVIIRPHPTENAETWKTLLIELGARNARVLEGTPHIPYMLASQITVHPGCTTGVEAQILNVPTLSLKIGESPVHDFYLCNRTNVTATSADEAFRLIDGHCRGGNQIRGSREQLMRVLGNYLEDMDSNILTADKIVDALETLASKQSFPKDHRNLHSVKWPDKEWEAEDPYYRQKFALTFAMVQQRLAAYQQTLNRFQDVKVKNIFNWAYHITSSRADHKSE